MKHLLAIAALSAMTIFGANAATFLQADNQQLSSQMAAGAQKGDGQVSMSEAWSIGISMGAFEAADANNNGKLSPTEFKNLK